MGKYNYVFSGKVIPIIAPYDVESGEGIIIGSLFGIVGNTAKAGERTVLHLEEVFQLPKTNTEIGFGKKVYWDVENRRVSDDAALPLIGVSIQRTTAADPQIEVRLNGVSLA